MVGAHTDEQAAPPAARPGLVSTVFKLLRVKQWSKNLLVFAGLLFSVTVRDPKSIAIAFEAFVAMCLVSSATYIVNDIRDVAKDRLHPKKRLRPIASGAVPVNVATGVAALCLAGGLGLGWVVDRTAFTILCSYLAVQIAYNAGLKKTPVADVYAISVGFVLRAALGAAAIHVTISGWLLFCTGALSLMLGFGKRRNEYILQGDARSSTRDSLVHYNRAALDALVIMFACAAAMCYGIYTLQSETAHKYPALIVTSPFVFYGITRYVLLVFIADEGGEPEEFLFHDKHILASIVLFLAAAAVALSGLRLPILELR